MFDANALLVVLANERSCHSQSLLVKRVTLPGGASDLTGSRAELICETAEWSATSTPRYNAGAGKQLLLPVLFHWP